MGNDRLIIFGEKMDCKPKLRFPEFSEKWEEKKVSDIAETIDGDRSSRYPNEKDLVDEGIIFLSTANIINNKLSFKEKRFITEKKFNELSKGHLEQNDLIVTLRGSIGIIVEFRNESYEKGFINAQMMIIRLNPDIPTVFFHNWYLTNQTQNNLSRISSGSAQPQLTKSDIQNLNIKLPSLKEQQKIASFLSKVDEKIEKLEKKHELWETYKRGILQQIFSQKLRFKDENGEDYPDWEEKKLGDIARFFKGKGVSKNDISRDGIECIRYGELYTTYKEEIKDIVSKTNLTIDGLVLSDKNDIIIPTSGETAIDIATASCVMKSGVAIGGDTTIIKTNENGLFLSYYLNNQRNKIAKMAQGVSVVHLYSNQLKLLELRIPTINEQNKIADFLSSIEIKIRILDKELKINQEFKRGLLQLMFC